MISLISASSITTLREGDAVLIEVAMVATPVEKIGQGYPQTVIATGNVAIETDTPICGFIGSVAIATHIITTSE